MATNMEKWNKTKYDAQNSQIEVADRTFKKTMSKDLNEYKVIPY